MYATLKQSGPTLRVPQTPPAFHPRVQRRSFASWNQSLRHTVCYFLPAAVLLIAAHRAFISWESLFRPAGVSSPFFRAALLTPLRFSFTHRAFAAAESFALAEADILFPPVLNAERDKTVPRSEARRFSKVPIWRRIKSASSNDLRDMSMSCG